MNLVLVTQVLDRQDAVLGFFARWVEGLAARVGKLRVVALEVGDVSGLPTNVDVRVLGRRGFLGRYMRYRRILNEAFAADGFDTLLTHMVPRYSTLAAGLARRHNVGHFLWYTHKGVDKRLTRAVEVVHKVFTASDESMRVDTSKKTVTGHGIDLQHFQPPAGGRDAVDGAPLRLLSVGRLTPAKDPLTLLRGLALLVERGLDVHLDWAGGSLAAGDEAYRKKVEREVQDLNLSERVHLHGAVAYTQIPDLYQRAHLFVSGSRTGSVDKVVLEAMACGLPVLTCNESFVPLLRELGGEAEVLGFAAGDPHGLAQRSQTLLEMPAAERADLGVRLRAMVARDHEVDALMDRLVQEMGERE